MAVDHRTLPRRRGEELVSAILQATLDELVEVGYAKLTMERVAERARASKASLYRRWPSRMELVMAAVYHAMPDPTSPPDTGSLRGDLLALLRLNTELLAGPAGEAMRGLLSEALGGAGRFSGLRRLSRGAGRTAMLEIVRRAVARGEMSPAAVTERRLEVAQALVRQHFLFHGAPTSGDGPANGDGPAKDSGSASDGGLASHDGLAGDDGLASHDGLPGDSLLVSIVDEVAVPLFTRCHPDQPG